LSDAAAGVRCSAGCCLVVKRSARAHYLQAANADELARWMAALAGGGGAGGGGR
jgi:hypothetical protein